MAEGAQAKPLGCCAAISQDSTLVLVGLLPSTSCAGACCAACTLLHLSLLQVTSARSQLLEYIQQEAGVATLLDVRRTQAYDAAKAVDALLDSPAARQWMRAAPQV